MGLFFHIWLFSLSGESDIYLYMLKKLGHKGAGKYWDEVVFIQPDGVARLNTLKK